MMSFVTPLPFFLSFCSPWMPSVSIDCLAFLQHQHPHHRWQYSKVQDMQQLLVLIDSHSTSPLQAGVEV